MLQYNLYANTLSYQLYRALGSILYGTKFSRSVIFTFFMDELQTAKIVLRKKNWQYSQLNVIRYIARHHTAGSMALLHYFSKASEVEKLPDPQGALAKDIPSSAISSANTEVQCILQGKKQQPAQKSRRKSYTKFTTEQKAENAKRAAENGIAATIHHFVKKYPNLKESSVHTWKRVYTAEIKRKRSVGVGDLDIKAYPKRKEVVLTC